MAKKRSDGGSDGAAVVDIEELAGLSAVPPVDPPAGYAEVTIAGNKVLAKMDTTSELKLQGDPAPEFPNIEEFVIHAMAVPVGTKISGYAGLIQSVSVDFPPALAAKFRRLLAALNQSHATYEMPGRTVHVDSGADAIKWLISQIPDLPATSS